MSLPMGRDVLVLLQLLSKTVLLSLLAHLLRSLVRDWTDHVD